MRARRVREGRLGVTIEVYSKEGCGICDAAKEKLSRMGLEFKALDLQEAIAPHTGWRDDETVEIMAGYAMIDNRLPLIRIEGRFHSYPSAMRRLKGEHPACAARTVGRCAAVGLSNGAESSSGGPTHTAGLPAVAH